MKNLLALSFIFSFSISVFVNNYCSAQTGWFWQNPLPSGNYYNESVFSNNTVYISAVNTVLKSTDLGSSWSTIKTVSVEQNNTRLGARFLKVFDSNNMYMLGSRYGAPLWDFSFYLMKTTNGGVIWDTLSMPYLGYNFITAFYFINQSTGYFTSAFTFQLFKTTNAGINWQNISINSDDTLTQLYFVNQNTGFISSGKHLPQGELRNYYRTTNGGSSWTTHTSPSGLYMLSNFNFINEQTGWTDGFFKTTNGGINFVSAAPWQDSIYKFGFINSNTGWAIMNHGLYSTTNGGYNWNLALLPEDLNYDFNSVNFRTDGIGFAVGPFGVIYKSTNFGIGWNKLDRNPRNFWDISDIDFINANTGIAVGYLKLLRTTDGGNNWNLADSVCSYNHVKFINDNDVLVSAGDYLGKSTNGGITWQYTLYGNYGFRGFKVFNENLIYTVGSTGIWGNDKIFRTTDKGTTWTQTNIPGGIYVELAFINPNTGWGTGELTPYKTTNGGLNWFVTNQQTASHVFFQSDNTWWGVGDSGIYKTTNTGVNWSIKLHNKPFGKFNSFNFVNQNTGYAFGGDYVFSIIYKTTDGGESWTDNGNITSNSLLKGFFINANTGWLVGTYGTIIKTTTGGTIGVQQISTSLPDKFYLSQNYPNPFNPVTNIEFSLPKNSFVKLKVFDLLGREVANLVNENLSAGSYKYDFNASALPSGIYFYKLETDNFSETRKMVLVK